MTFSIPTNPEDDFEPFYEGTEGVYAVHGDSRSLLLQMAEALESLNDNIDELYHIWEKFDERQFEGECEPLSPGMKLFILPLGGNSSINVNYPLIRNKDAHEAIKTLLFDRVPTFYTNIQPSVKNENELPEGTAPRNWETYAEIAKEYNWVFEHFPPASSLDSPIRRLGYIVGKRGLERTLRHEFLETFYNLSLPAEEDKTIINEWGAPGSDKRKQRMYDHLTGLAAFREMMDSQKYNMAIEHWREDADFVWAL